MAVPPDNRPADPPGGASPPGVPGWVKALVAVVVGLILLAILLQLTGIGGDHGPGRHGPRNHGAAGEEVSSPVIVGAPASAVNARQLAFEPDRVELDTGSPVKIELTSSDVHHLVVDEIGFHVAADRGETDTGGLVFDTPGTYVGYCSVPGHRQAGMALEFVVAEDRAGHRSPVGH